jgi:hypothetical protein
MSGQAEFRAALFAPETPAPSGLKSWNGSDVERRFDVYRNNVVVSLVKALRDAYPVCATLVGDEFFGVLARAFVEAHPPRSKMMAQFGGEFPDFLATFAIASGLAYLPGVARLEAARVASYHAADAPVLGVEAFAGVPTDQIGELRAQLHPAVRVVRSSSKVFSIWAAHHGVGVLDGLDPFSPEDAIVRRPGLDVEVLRAPPGVAAALVALGEGATIAEAAEAGLSAAASFDVNTFLGLIVTGGVATSITSLSITLSEETAP